MMKLTPHFMIRNLLKICWRNIWRNKFHSVINVIGLTLGIVCFLLISLYVFDELTFDRHHVNSDRIFRVVEHRNAEGEATSVAAVSYNVGEESRKLIPEIENSTKILRLGRANLVDPENPVNFHSDITTADERFLQIFDFPLISGDRDDALKEPNSIIITEDLAMRIFNRKDVMGKNLRFSNLSDFKITGILKNLPLNSSFSFNSLISESTFYSTNANNWANDWTSNFFGVYTLLRPHADTKNVSEKIIAMVISNKAQDEGARLTYSLQPLKDMHFKSADLFSPAVNTNGNLLHMSVFSIVAVLVLLISAINYTNLATARATGQAKEIGVRKTMGASRSYLITQFLSESMLTIAIGFVFAVFVIGLVLPPFNRFAHKQLSLDLLTDFCFWIYAISFVVIVGLLSGSYTALFLSRLKPVSALKGIKLRDPMFRKILVIFQFTISIVMIVGTIVLFLQGRYLNKADMGFNKDLMVVIDVNTGAARSGFQAIKDDMSGIPSVKSVSVSSRVPGEWKSIASVKMYPEGRVEDRHSAYLIGADPDFIKTYEISLLQGRNFYGPNDANSILINETAARILNISGPLEQVIEIPLNGNMFKARIIGIVKDFHFQSLYNTIQPLILAYNQNPVQEIDYFSVRIASSDIQLTLDKLKEIMLTHSDSTEPFEYHFLDEQIALFYLEDQRRQTILTWSTLITVLIACLGLFGLATYAVEKRIKEIGIRKVLGASVTGVVSLLSFDFIKLVLIANIAAFPIAWWVTHNWLQNYAYHIQVKWWIFIIAGILAVVIALVTVSYQAVRSAVTNPVKSLKQE